MTKEEVRIRGDIEAKKIGTNFSRSKEENIPGNRILGDCSLCLCSWPYSHIPLRKRVTTAKWRCNEGENTLREVILSLWLVRAGGDNKITRGEQCF